MKTTELIERLNKLINALEKSNNSSVEFFRTVISELEIPQKRDEALSKLSTCYSITQYADFSLFEEKLLDDVLELI